jgi:hypothetical protein
MLLLLVQLVLLTALGYILTGLLLRIMATTVPFSPRSVDNNIPLSHFSTPFIPILLAETEPMSISQKMNLQLTSPIFDRLPGELRNQIYELALTSSAPVIDPSIPPTFTAYAKALNLRTSGHRVPELGTALLRTCKRIYSEVSLATLYSNNAFRFTTSFSAQRFLSALPMETRKLIREIEVDLQEVNDAHPAVEREWVQYLVWAPQLDSLWAAKVGSLHLIAPNVKTLRFNIEGWKVRETMRSVALLKEVLHGPRDLERVVMTGVDGSKLLFGSKEKYLESWGPVAFVGVMRFARLAGMVSRMAECIAGEPSNKIVTWEKSGHRVSLEIMTKAQFKRQSGPEYPRLVESGKFDPMKGACSLEAYEIRWHSGEWPNSVKG